MLALRGSAPNIFMSRAESHEVGGEDKDPGSGGVAVGGGEGTRASHEKAGGDSLMRFNLSVIV
jgi:hypothetical protein